MKRKKAAIITFGCQMNKYDSEVIEGILDDEGYEATEKLAEADFILVNTCSIRDKAEQKLYSQLGRLKELKSANPELLIAVSGCVAQVQGSAIVDRAPLRGYCLRHSKYPAPASFIGGTSPQRGLRG